VARVRAAFLAFTRAVNAVVLTVIYFAVLAWFVPLRGRPVHGWQRAELPPSDRLH